MKWKVAGAMRETGQDRQFEFDAPTEEEAVHQATAYGLVVSSIAPIGMTPVGFRPAVDYSPPARSTREYAEITSAANWLQIWVTIIGIVGGVVLALGGILALFSVIALGQPETDRAQMWSNVYLGITGIVTGSFILAVAATMNMIARCGGAIRDIARNSHR